MTIFQIKDNFDFCYGLAVATHAHQSCTGLGGNGAESYMEHLCAVTSNVQGEAAKQLAIIHEISSEGHVLFKHLQSHLDPRVFSALVSLTPRETDQPNEWLYRCGKDSLARVVTIGCLRDKIARLNPKLYGAKIDAQQRKIEVLESDFWEDK